MEINQLKTFFAIIEEQSFSRAAQRLFLTQPAVSFQIKALEKELDEVLFDRSSKNLHLTKAGKILEQYGRQIFHALDSVKSEIGEVRNLVQGNLSIGCSDTLSSYYLPRLLGPFLQKYPSLDITVRNNPSVKIVESVLQRELDIGIVTMPVDHTQLRTKRLISYTDIAVFSPQSHFAGNDCLTLRELSKTRLLLLERGTRHRSLIEKEFRNQALVLEKVIAFGSVGVQKAFARTGIGVAIVPDFAVQEEIEQGVLCRAAIQGLSRRSAGVIINKKSNMSPAGRTFLQTLLTWADENK